MDEKQLLWVIMHEKLIKPNGSIKNFLDFVVDELRKYVSGEEVEKIFESIKTDRIKEIGLTPFGAVFCYTKSEDGCLGKYYSFRKHDFMHFAEYVRAQNLIEYRILFSYKGNLESEEARKIVQGMDLESISDLVESYEKREYPHQIVSKLL